MKNNFKAGNKGFILIATLLVGTVLTILSSAYFASSLSQSNIAKKQFVSIQEYYNAESGGKRFSLMAEQDVLTHKIMDPFTGELAADPSGTSQFSADIVDADVFGNLVLNRGGRVIAKGKIYQKEADTIILVRAIDTNGNEAGPVHRYITGHKSLYKYFQFYDNGSPDPGSYRWNPGDVPYKGKIIDATAKVGGIHVNGDISLDETVFINLSELSVSRDFYYSYEPNYDTLVPHEPASWDFYYWYNSSKYMQYFYNKSSCADCKIDGLAPVPRSGGGPRDFLYPLGSDMVLGGEGVWRGVFHHPNMWSYGGWVTDDWVGTKSPRTYGESYFWMKDYDLNSNDSYIGGGVVEEDEIKRIPKILVSSGGNYDKDMYSGEPGDNRVLVPPYFWTLSTSAPPNCAEPPVRFEVVGTSATISNPSSVDSVTKLAFKYDALRWLANKEEGAGEYSTSYSNWLTTAVTTTASGCSGAVLTNDGNWDPCEYDRVTLLSLEAEAGTAGLALNSGKGLYNNSEYNIYKAVKLKMGGSASWSAGLDPSVATWITSATFSNYDSTSDLTADFFAWWRSRRYHHKESLTDCSAVSYGGNWCFASDTLTQTTDAYGNVSKAVPAWERLFWEARLNYWPPARGKAHNQVYTPANYNHAINPEWWEDLVAGTNRPSSGPDQTQSVPYFNTAVDAQADAFAVWLSSSGRGLYNTTDPENSIVKFREHGGEYLNPLNIKERYSPLAQEYGLYIKQNADNSFSAKLNGSLVAENTTLANCLYGLDNSGTWIYERTFYNPYTITRGKTQAKNTYDPSQKDPAETDKTTTTWIDPYSQVYGQSTCPGSVSNPLPALPPPVKVIEIDLSRLRSTLSLTRPVIYIESPDYDTRLVNGFSLPAGDGTLENPGGFTLVSPYDVYVKAQKKSEADIGVDFDGDGNAAKANVYRGFFNYEAADRVDSVPLVLDANFRPAAVITNSRVYLLSSEFKDVNATFPYSHRFPGTSFDSSLQTYCYPRDNYSPAKPALNLYTTTWVNANRSISQISQLWSWGESAYDAAFGPSGTNQQVNTVKYNQSFNLAIASPFEPRGYRLERWANNESHSVKVPIFLEGAFIKTGFWKNSDNTSVLSRYHTPVPGPLNSPIACYEMRRFNISYGTDMEKYKVYNILPTESATYEYEERFWNPYERPAGDFLASGSQRRRDQLSGANAFNNDTPVPSY